MVLAGGGYVASSWEIGVITGMADAGLDVRDADLFVGTSAGARVVLDLTSDATLEEIYQRRVVPGAATPEPAPQSLDWNRIRAGIEEAKRLGGAPADVLRRYGTLALEVSAGDVTGRREALAPTLSRQTWPTQRALIVAANAETGERRAFDRESGIDLVDAVLATTASFGTPPILFEGHSYIDGGYHSSDNADLATGYERVLVLALRSPPNAMRLVPIEAGVEALRASGAEVEVIHPDDEALAALVPTGGQMNPASGRGGNRTSSG